MKVKILSRHSTHNPLRMCMDYPKKTVIRFGSTTQVLSPCIEINTVQAIKQTANKVVMKELFKSVGVLSPEFFHINATPTFPCVVKRVYHSRGRDMVFIETPEQLEAWRRQHVSDKYQFYIEANFDCNREYRIHYSPWFGELFAIRKMKRADTGFGRNLGNSYFSKDFTKPSCWDDMLKESHKAMVSLKLDLGSVDILYNKDTRKFNICEINSASSLGEITCGKYKDAMPVVIKNKENGRSII